MAFIVKEIPGAACPVDLPRVYPLELADNIDGIAPAGTPIMSTCFIAEMMDAAISNGRDEWRRIGDDGTIKTIAAGESWAGLF